MDESLVEFLKTCDLIGVYFLLPLCLIKGVQIMSETNALLLEIQVAAGCSYLSDLHNNYFVLSDLAKRQI